MIKIICCKLADCKILHNSKRYHDVCNFGNTVRSSNLPFYCTKAGKNDFQVFIRGDWIQLTHKEYIFWRCDILLRQVSNLQGYISFVQGKIDLMHVCKVMSQISLCSLRRLVMDYTFCINNIFCFEEVYS